MPSQLYNPYGKPADTGAPGLEAGILAYNRHSRDTREAIAKFRAAAPLPRDAQILFDKAVIQVGRERLNLVDDLLSAGLTFDLPQWLGVPTLYYEKVGEAGHAQRTMVPKARGERQLQEREGAYLPIYCTWDDFSFNVREMAVAERAGVPLDTSHAQGATRNVNVAIEDQAFNGSGFNVGGFGAPGLFNFSGANTFTYTGGEAWDAAGHTGEEILADIQGGMDVLEADKFYGPYRIYVPRNYWAKLNLDYKPSTSSSTTTLQRILEMPDVASVRPAYQLPDDRVVILQMTSDVVDVVVGQQPTQVSWTDGPGWERFFVILACMVVRWKSNILGGTGFAIGNLT